MEAKEEHWLATSDWKTLWSLNWFKVDCTVLGHTNVFHSCDEMSQASGPWKRGLRLNWIQRASAKNLQDFNRNPLAPPVSRGFPLLWVSAFFLMLHWILKVQLWNIYLKHSKSSTLQAGWVKTSGEVDPINSWTNHPHLEQTLYWFTEGRG